MIVYCGAEVKLIAMVITSILQNSFQIVLAVKSSLAQTGSAVNKDSHKDVEVYW